MCDGSRCLRYLDPLVVAVQPLAPVRRVVLRASIFSFSLALIAHIGLAVPLISQTGHERRVHVSLTDLCVTEGTITALLARRLLVTDPNVAL